MNRIQSQKVLLFIVIFIFMLTIISIPFFTNLTIGLIILFFLVLITLLIVVSYKLTEYIFIGGE